MRMYDIIMKKRNGGELNSEEIDFFIQNYTSGIIPDYQASALLMAIYFNKMNKRETADLTMSIVNSGERLDLSGITGIKVDKHSTGGVGDKTSLVLGPMVAACKVPVAKMSGRGLGHTGGTIDKLESIKGFTVEMSKEKLISNVNTIGLAIGGQTGNLTPGDKKLYALRDVTATIDNISLIASSIMSKKIAAGADAIVLDVKVGSGAFMKDTEGAFELAKEMVDIGTAVNKNTVAIISDMNQPLGKAVGNALEVGEAIDTLKGNGPDDLLELCLVLGSYMLKLSGKVADLSEARYILLDTILKGTGLSKFKEFVEFQGGDSEVVNSINLLPMSKYKKPLIAQYNGYIEKIYADQIGMSSQILGAGRETKDSKIDLSVGIVLEKKVGDVVRKGDRLATIHGNDQDRMKLCYEKVLKAYKMSDEPLQKRKLIYGVVTDKDIQIF